jgi:hypothetical protein
MRTFLEPRSMSCCYTELQDDGCCLAYQRQLSATAIWNVAQLALRRFQLIFITSRS